MEESCCATIAPGIGRRFAECMGNGMMIHNDQFFSGGRNHKLLVVMFVQQRWLSEEALERRKRKQASQGVWNITSNSRGTWNGCRLGRSRDTLLHNSPYIFFTCFLSAPIDRLDGSESITVPKASQTYHPYHIWHTILIISDIPFLSYLTYHPHHIRHTILFIADIPSLSYLTYHSYHIRHTILIISDMPSLSYQTYLTYHIRHAILII